MCGVRVSSSGATSTLTTDAMHAVECGDTTANASIHITQCVESYTL
jgi:hypothetical protein